MSLHVSHDTNWAAHAAPLHIQQQYHSVISPKEDIPVIHPPSHRYRTITPMTLPDDVISKSTTSPALRQRVRSSLMECHPACCI